MSSIRVAFSSAVNSWYQDCYWWFGFIAESLSCYHVWPPILVLSLNLKLGVSLPVSGKPWDWSILGALVCNLNECYFWTLAVFCPSAELRVMPYLFWPCVSFLCKADIWFSSAITLFVYAEKFGLGRLSFLPDRADLRRLLLLPLALLVGVSNFETRTLAFGLLLTWEMLVIS